MRRSGRGRRRGRWRVGWSLDWAPVLIGILRMFLVDLLERRHAVLFVGDSVRMKMMHRANAFCVDLEDVSKIRQGKLL